MVNIFKINKIHYYNVVDVWVAGQNVLKNVS